MSGGIWNGGLLSGGIFPRTMYTMYSVVVHVNRIINVHFVKNYRFFFN